MYCSIGCTLVLCYCGSQQPKFPWEMPYSNGWCVWIYLYGRVSKQLVFGSLVGLTAVQWSNAVWQCDSHALGLRCITQPWYPYYLLLGNSMVAFKFHLYLFRKLDSPLEWDVLALMCLAHFVDALTKWISSVLKDAIGTADNLAILERSNAEYLLLTSVNGPIQWRNYPILKLGCLRSSFLKLHGGICI